MCVACIVFKKKITQAMQECTTTGLREGQKPIKKFMNVGLL
jgi:hypothetical protein